MLKISAFYLDKQISFIPKKIWSVPCTMIQPTDAVFSRNSPSIYGTGVCILQSLKAFPLQSAHAKNHTSDLTKENGKFHLSVLLDETIP